MASADSVRTRHLMALRTRPIRVTVLVSEASPCSIAAADGDAAALWQHRHGAATEHGAPNSRAKTLNAAWPHERIYGHAAFA